MRAVPALRDEVFFEREMPARKRVTVFERLDTLDAFRIGNPQLEYAVVRPA